MQKATIPLTILLLFASVSGVSAEVQLGPAGGAGYINLTNPDDSYYYFDSGNMSKFSYIHNMPDGWWNFPPVIDESWVLGVLLGLAAFSIAVIALYKRKTKDDE